MKPAQHNLYHRFLSLLKKNKIQNKKLLLALSGGMDSTALLALMSEVRRPLNLDLTMASVHHGESLQNPYREEALCHLYSLSFALGIPFLYNRPRPQKKTLSENDLRKKRYTLLRQWRQKTNAQMIVTAHTASDVLETRLIRLIRGTGPQGLLSMSFLKEDLLRPLLFFTRDEVEDYIQKQKWLFIEDPSNKTKGPLRNWIRKTWLKPLEKRQKGASAALARSLETLSMEVHRQKAPLPFLLSKKGIDKKKFKALPVEDKKRALAHYMRSFHLKNYGETHIEEVLKHLGAADKSFRLLKKNWKIDREFIKIQPF